MNKTMLSLILAGMLSLSLGMQAQKNQNKGGGRQQSQPQARQQSAPRQQAQSQPRQQAQPQARQQSQRTYSQPQQRTQVQRQAPQQRQQTQTYSRQTQQRQSQSYGAYARRDNGGHVYDTRTFGRQHYSHFSANSFVYRGGHQSIYFGGYYFWANEYPSWFYTCNVYFELGDDMNWYGMCYDRPSLRIQVFVY